MNRRCSILQQFAARVRRVASAARPIRLGTSAPVASRKYGGWVGLFPSAPRRSLIGVLGMAVLCSCADFTAPKYQRPEMPAKASWSRTPANLSVSDTISPDWWNEFRDPYLNSLVERAIGGNFDLKVLAARIR